MKDCRKEREKQMRMVVEEGEDRRSDGKRSGT